MNIVIVWASNNPNKFWYKIISNLLSKWINIIPINPKETVIQGLKVYKDINEITQKFNIVNFVLKPKIVLNILKENKLLLKSKILWFQPWSSNLEIKDFLEKNNFKKIILDSCIMIENIKDL